MISSAKKVLFYSILVLFILTCLEAGTRGIYYARYRRVSHLLPPEEVEVIRKAVSYERNNDTAPVAKGDYLVKNGYYVVNPEAYIFPELKPDINSLGFRGKEPDDSRDRKTILCLGGSSTFGYKCTKPYPEALEEELNRDGNEYSVINGGVPGFNAQHIYNMLRDKELISALRPDILVFNNTWNTLTQYENGFLVESVENRFIRAIIARSVICFFIYKAILRLRYKEFLGPFQAMRIYVDKICGLAAERGMTIFLVNEPMVLSDEAWQAAPEHPKNHKHAAMIFKTFEEKYKGSVFFVPMEFFETMNFDDKNIVDRYFIDKGHLTREGYAIEAQEIAQAILMR